jgi:hypothetical protein
MNLHRRSPRWLAVFASLVVAATASGCAQPTADRDWVGGPATPSPLQVTAVDISHLGAAVPTGLVVDGAELVLILENAVQYDVQTIWRDTHSGVISRDPPRDNLATTTAGGGPTTSLAPFRTLAQINLGDGRVVEFGDIQAAADRITVDDKGHVTDAAYTTSTYDKTVVLFWVVRQGNPIPENSQIDIGHSTPLAPELYPLVTAYRDGAAIASARMRPSATTQH